MIIVITDADRRHSFESRCSEQTPLVESSSCIAVGSFFSLVVVVEDSHNKIIKLERVNERGGEVGLCRCNERLIAHHFESKERKKRKRHSRRSSSTRIWTTHLHLICNVERLNKSSSLSRLCFVSMAQANRAPVIVPQPPASGGVQATSSFHSVSSVDSSAEMARYFPDAHTPEFPPHRY